MNKKLFAKGILLILFFFRMNMLYAQVTVENLDVTENDKYKRPPQYDSTKNFPFPLNFNPYNNDNFHYNGNDSTLYNGFIGLHIYLPPHIQVAGDAYYKIVDIYYIAHFLKQHPNLAYEKNDKFPMYQYTDLHHLRPHPIVYAPYDTYYQNHFGAIKNAYYLYYHTFKCFTDSGAKVNYLFLLKNDKTGDTIYYSPDYGQFGEVHAIMVPYFLKQKAKYDGKTLTYVRGRYGCSFWDAKTGEMLTMQKDSKWTCQVTVLKQSEVSLAQHSKQANPLITPNSFYDQYYLNYILTDGTHEIVVSGEPVAGSSMKEGEAREDVVAGMSHFLTDEEYKESLMQKAELEAQKKAKQEKYKQECIKNYGEKYGALIADHRVEIGMPMKMCEAAWGEPLEVITAVSSSGSVAGYDAAWLYTYKTYLYFRNGNLIQIEN